MLNNKPTTQQIESALETAKKATQGEWRHTRDQKQMGPPYHFIKVVDCEISDVAMRVDAEHITQMQPAFSIAVMEELLENRIKLNLAFEALNKISCYFDCTACETNSNQMCEHHLQDRMKTAKDAIKAMQTPSPTDKGAVEG